MPALGTWPVPLPTWGLRLRAGRCIPTKPEHVLKALECRDSWLNAKAAKRAPPLQPVAIPGSSDELNHCVHKELHRWQALQLLHDTQQAQQPVKASNGQLLKQHVTQHKKMPHRPSVCSPWPFYPKELWRAKSWQVHLVRLVFFRW
eukprot:3410424-Amphidinium_carterae.1